MGQRVSSLEKAIKVLNAIKDFPEPIIGVSELARILNFNRSHVLTILKTLEDFGFVEQNNTHKKYKLGLKLIELGEAARQSPDLAVLAHNTLVKLNKQTGLTIFLGVLFRERIYILDRVETKGEVHVSVPIGGEYLPFVGGVGKSLLINQTEDELLAIYEKYKETEEMKRIALSSKEFIRVIASVKDDGIGVGIDESITGLSNIGAPIINDQKEAVGAIGLTGFTSIVKKDLNQLTIKVKEAAGEISRLL